MEPDKAALGRLGHVIAEKYRLDRLLGAGGMGAVYEAFHLYTERRVAVKLLHAAVAQASSVAATRFLREAKAAAAIDHPAVIEVLDAGQDADGAPYLVFELLDGETLAEALARGRLTQGDLIRLIDQILELLSVAHDRGIVHRDIKPENIFVLSKSDGSLSAKLLDFGIARQITGRVGDGITQVGTVLGTPFYMAPEQMQGLAIEGTADIWSVGAVLYRALSGRLPFESRSFVELINEMGDKGAKSLAEHRPDLPPKLIEAVDRALARNPRDRWPSATALRAALQPFLRPSKQPLAPTHDEGTDELERQRIAKEPTRAPMKVEPWKKELSRIEEEIADLKSRRGIVDEDQVSTDEEPPEKVPWFRRILREKKD